MSYSPRHFSLAPLRRKRAAVFGMVLWASVGLLAGCAGKGSQSSSPSAESASAPTVGAAAPGATSDATAGKSAETKTAAPAAVPRKIIYTATVGLVADDFPRAAAQIVREAKARNGYVAENSVTGEPNAPREGTWKIRVPLPELDAFLAALGKMGELQNTTLTSQDVSEEFYDVRARLQNKRIEEARLIDLLQHSSGKLSDVLLLEKEISRVREEIERMEGRLRFLANQTDLATVTVTLHEAKAFKKPEAPPTFGTRLVRTFSGSVETLFDFVRGLMLLVVAVLPWMIVPGVLLFYVLHRRRKERTSHEPK